MKLLWIILIFLLWHAVNIFLAWQNKQLVQKRLNHKDFHQVEHFLWGLMYAALCVPWYFIFGLWFTLALIPLHLSVFPIAYNDYRGMTPFNLSKTSKASTDKLMVKIGLKSTEGVNLASEGLSIIFLIITILKYEQFI